MNWARRLKRVFGIDLEACSRCGGKLRILASIEEPELIARILSHLARAAAEPHQLELRPVQEVCATDGRSRAGGHIYRLRGIDIYINI